jgi:hypothetical protein
MAQKTVIVDDIDGGPATQTVHFSLEHVDYIIDLNDKNADRLRADFQKYIDGGRKHRLEAAARATKRGGVARSEGPDTAAVREWARASGYEVSERGRVSSKIIDAYRAAN